MKKQILTLIAGILLAGLATNSIAEDQKEVTITGDMVCGKCTLHETKKCTDVVQVSQNGKTVNYYLANNTVSKAAHKPICGGSSEKVTVTGTVTDKDGKKMMTPTQIVPAKS